MRWRRGSGLSIRIALADAVAVVDATRVPLPIPDYDSAAPPPALPDDFPWPVITRLLGDALLTRGVAWLEGLATLTRWDRSLPTVVTFPAAVPVGDLPGLPVERLPLDPAGVVRDWVAELLRDVEGVAAAQLAGWLGALASGTAPGGGPFEAQVGGGGTAADPYAVGLGTAAGAAELLAWFEPDGSTLVGVPGLVLPPELTGPLDLLEGDPPDPEALAALLREAARSLPELAPVADGRPGLGAGLAELLARLADSDGLVPAAAQRAAGRRRARPGGAHPRRGAARLRPARAPSGRRRPGAGALRDRARAGARGVAAPRAAPLVDLTEPGLAPEALDLSGLTGAGPWFVRLATRAAAGGPAEQAARLGRAVTAALATLPAGATVTVVAHGPAALAARTLASAPGSGIDHLVALAAPLAGATAEFLDEPATGDAARALQALAPMLSAEARENPFAADGLALVDLLGALLDPGPGAAFPLADYRLAGPAEALPGSVGATTIAVTFGAGSAARAIASLVRQAISSALERLRSDRPADAIGLGARVRLGTDQPAFGRVEARAQLRADLHRFRLRDGATEQSLPRVVGTLQLRRTDGWLAGGPRSDHDPAVPREPRLRWAELRVAGEAGAGGMTWRSTVTLHEAAALGVSRPAWVIDLTGGGGLDEESRVLLGRLASALGEPDAGPAAAAAVELFRALGLVEGAGASLGFVVDAAEQLLVDPAAAVASRLDDPATAAPLLAALRTLAGPALAEEERSGEDLTMSAGGLEIGLRLTGSRGLLLRTGPGGLPLASGLALEGSAELPAAGPPSATLRVGPAGPGGPGGSLALALAVEPAAPRPVTLALHSTGPSGATTSAELFPAPDTAALTAMLVRLVPAELVRLGLGFAAEAAPDAVEPLLVAVGLRGPDDPPGFVRHPAGLLADPLGWLRRALGSGAGLDGAAVQGLVDGLRALIGGTGPSGTLPLPWGLRAQAGPGAGGSVALELGWAAPQVAGGVELSAAVDLGLPADGPPEATLAAAISLTAAPGAARVDVALGAAPLLTVRIVPAGEAEVVLPIVPAGGPGGLAGAAAAGVRALLPVVLDALVDAGSGGPPALAAVGDAVEALGDALALRTAAGFDAAALTRAGAGPARRARQPPPRSRRRRAGGARGHGRARPARRDGHRERADADRDRARRAADLVVYGAARRHPRAVRHRHRLRACRRSRRSTPGCASRPLGSALWSCGPR